MALNTTLTTIATTLLQEFGEAITLTRTTPGTYNPGTLSNESGATTATYTGYAVPDPTADKGERPGSLAQLDSIRLVVNKLTVAPLPDDRLTFAGVEHRVLNVEFVRLSGADVIYLVDVAK